MRDPDARSTDPETYDDLTAGLRGLRAAAGYPSFSEIVLMIARQREARGIPREAARPGRTTVYDAFQPGRRRMDHRLVGEIVRALGVEEDTALEWEHRCRVARKNARKLKPTQPEPGAQSETQSLPEAQASLEAESLPEAQSLLETETPPTSAPPPPSTPEPEPELEAEPGSSAPPDPAPPEATAAPTPVAPHTRESTAQEAPASPHSLRWVLLLMTAGVLINLVGRLLVSVLDLPLHLDMVGTALAAIAAGPWTGAIVAVLSSSLGVPMSGPVSLLFLPVNVAGALVWGYGVHRFGLGRTLGRFFLLTLAAAVVCSLVAVPLLLLAGGSVGHGDDVTVDVARSLVGSLPLAILLSNLIYSVADKLLSGFLALALVDSLLRGGTVAVAPPDDAVGHAPLP